MNDDRYENKITYFYNNIEVRKIINAAGTLTSLGGNRISSNVLNSMKQISQIFVDMEKLSRDVGNHIANRLGVEAAYVTASGSAGIVLSIIAATYRLKSSSYDNPVDTDNENYVAIQRIQKSEFRSLVNFADARIIEYGDENNASEDSLIYLLTKYRNKIVAILHFVFDPLPGSLPLKNVINIAHSFNIPVIVDAAAELPPKENLTKFVNMGADAVVFSGGKMIGSLSNSGIVLGSSDFIKSISNIGPLMEKDCNNNPKIYPGRPMKTSKEILIATASALDEFLELDEKEWMDNLKNINNMILNEINQNTNIASASIVSPKWYHPRPAIIPRVEIKLKNNLSVDKLRDRLKHNLIYVYTDENMVYINPQCLEEKDVPALVSNIITCLEEINY